MPKSFAFGIALAMFLVPASRAQSTSEAPAQTSTAASQAPDDVMKKLSDLVHAAKYADARQSVTALLILYPDDQRLLKAKALLDKSPASADATNAAPATAAPSSNATPTNNPAPAAQPANTNAEQLTGMDKVDYSALIELARQAQQTTDLSEQKSLLKRFMTQSDTFLQKHPTEMLLWQLRATSAISLNSPLAGYEAGMKLVSMGAADSNDPNLQALLGALKNKGWLDQQSMQTQQHEQDVLAKFSWLAGTWKVSWSWDIKRVFEGAHDRGTEVFVVSGSSVEGYEITASGARGASPDFRVQLSDQQLNWECFIPPSDPGDIFVYRSHFPLGSSSFYTIGRRVDGEWERKRTFYPNGWQPVVSSQVVGGKRTMTITIPSQSLNSNPDKHAKNPVVLTFTKISDAQDEVADRQQ
jgi:hypothetical protein